MFATKMSSLMHVYMEFERILFWHVSFWWNFELPQMRPKWGCHSLILGFGEYHHWILQVKYSLATYFISVYALKSNKPQEANYVQQFNYILCLVQKSISIILLLSCWTYNLPNLKVVLIFLFVLFITKSSVLGKRIYNSLSDGKYKLD